MSEEQKTVADIVREIRNFASVVENRDGDVLYCASGVLGCYADRIEAAAKLENARLRAALKPVLECSLRGCVYAVCNDGKLHHISGLVLAAQRIYNEGEAAQKKGGEE